MNQGIYSLAATMVNQLNRVDVLSNNLANANTNAFKQNNLVQGSFNHYMTKNLQHNDLREKINEVTNTVPKIDGNFYSDIEGAVEVTGNKLDFSINARDVFFKVQNNNNDIVLTKDGAFKNINGFLVTSEGNNVLNSENEKIIVAEGFENQIALIKSSYNNLSKQGNNNYLINDNNNVQNVLINENYLIQGSVEKSNVNTITTMVALIDSQRRLEQAQKASTGIDEINQKLIDKITR